MKTIKRFACLLLALAMCLALGVTAMADTSSAADGFTITVTGAAVGETYSAYKIFDVTYDTDAGAYSYTIGSDSVWYNTVAAATDVFTLTQIGDSTTYNVMVNDGVEDDAVVAVFTEAGVPEGAEAAATAQGVADEESGEVAAILDVSDSGAGYYFVTTTVGSLVIIDTTDPTQEIEDKNGQPVIRKYVHENNASEGRYGLEDDAYNGETILFEIEVANINGAVNLVVHDSTDSELEIPDESNFHMTGVTLYLTDPESSGYNEETDKVSLTEGTDYTITIGECSGVNCTLEDCAFEIHFLRSFDDVDPTGYLEITYELILNTEGDGYEEDFEEANNYAQVTYGTQSCSAPAQAETYSYGFEINKYAAKDAEAAQVRVWRTQNWVQDVNVYTGGMGGVKSIYLEPGVYTFVVDGTSNDRWNFNNFNEYALVEVTGSEPTASIKTEDDQGNTVYIPTEENGGYTIAGDDSGNYNYYILESAGETNEELGVVTVEKAGLYVLAAYMYDPIYHGDVGGINWADWQWSTAYYYYDTSHISNKVDKVGFNGDGTVTYYWENTAYGAVSTVEMEINASLAGAKFELTKDDETAYFKVEDFLGEDNETVLKTIYLFEGWLEDDAKIPEGCTSELISSGEGMIYVEGLDAGQYTLTETEAPDGYNKLSSSITVTITAEYDEETGALLTHTVTWQIGSEKGEGVVDVENTSSSRLPGTGGIGTTIFYVVGGALVIAAVVLLVTRRRMKGKAGD